MSQVLSASGIAEGLADGLKTLFGPAAILTVPLLAGLFGYITSASSVSNGLLMHSQVALVENSKIICGAAIQNVASAALTMVSPARLALVSHLAGTDERNVVSKIWPLALAPILILLWRRAGSGCPLAASRPFIIFLARPHMRPFLNDGSLHEPADGYIFA